MSSSHGIENDNIVSVVFVDLILDLTGKTPFDFIQFSRKAGAAI